MAIYFNWLNDKLKVKIHVPTMPENVPRWVKLGFDRKFAEVLEKVGQQVMVKA